MVLEKKEPWEDYPPEAIDFINKCILKDPKKRIGRLTDVKEHPWFKDFDWEALKAQTMEPLYVPNQDVSQNFDQKNVNEFDYKDADQLKEFDRTLKQLEFQQDNFGEYFYDISKEKS